MDYFTKYGIYLDKFFHIVADPLCAHHRPHFGKLWFKLYGVLIKLLNLRWPLNVIIIFYIFCNGYRDRLLKLAADNRGTRQFGGANLSASQFVGKPIWRENK